MGVSSGCLCRCLRRECSRQRPAAGTPLCPASVLQQLLAPAPVGPPPCAADGGKPVGWLNELEYIDGRIWANIWQTDCIAHIDPASGAVTGWLRLDGLRERTLQVAAADLAAAGGGAAAGQREPPEVLNGVTYDAEQQRLFVTGKLWPRVYQIEAVEVPAQQAEQALARARRECVIHSR